MMSRGEAVEMLVAGAPQAGGDELQLFESAGADDTLLEEVRLTTLAMTVIESNEATDGVLDRLEDVFAGGEEAERVGERFVTLLVASASHRPDEVGEALERRLGPAGWRWWHHVHETLEARSTGRYRIDRRHRALLEDDDPFSAGVARAEAYRASNGELVSVRRGMAADEPRLSGDKRILLSALAVFLLLVLLAVVVL